MTNKFSVKKFALALSFMCLFGAIGFVDCHYASAGGVHEPPPPPEPPPPFQPSDYVDRNKQLGNDQPPPLPPKQCNRGPNMGSLGPNMVGDPIDIRNGNHFESYVDFSFPTPNRKGFAFRRNYNSGYLGPSGYIPPLYRPFGYNWTNNYSLILSVINHNGQLIEIIDETGRGVYFQEDTASGQWLGIYGDKTHLTPESGGYVWHRLDGARYYFSGGKLIWLEDEVGNRQSLTYYNDPFGGLLATVNDEASGRVITFNYAPGSYLLESISGPNGTLVTYDIHNVSGQIYFNYGSQANLYSVTYADGSGFTYEYDTPVVNSKDDAECKAAGLSNCQWYFYSNLTAKRDKQGRLLGTWKYDGGGKVYQNSDTRDGKDVQINYGCPLQVTDAYGVTRNYTLETVNGISKVTSIEGPGGCQTCAGDGPIRYAYDADSNIIEKEYANGTIHKYSNFDAQGNPGTVILAFGAPEQRTINYTYHPETNAPLTRIELSTLATPGNDIYKETIWDYDADYNTTANESEFPTRLVSRIIEKGHTRDSNGIVVPHDDQITVFQYNSKGQVIIVDGPLPGTQDSISYAYEPTTGDLLIVTPALPLNGTISFPQADYDAAGNPGKMTDLNGQSTAYTYDGRYRLLTTAINGVQTARSFNLAGDLDTVTDSGGRVLDYDYDPAYGRLERITDMAANYLSYSYDAQGNRTVDSTYDVNDTIKRWLGFDYQNPADPGKLWKIINHNDTGTGLYDTETIFENNYVANTKKVTDALGREATYLYNPLNRLAQIEQPGLRFTDYYYDSQGNPGEVIDATGKSTTYQYDDLGLVVSATSQDTGTTTYSYDLVNNQKMVKYPGNITVTYSYDTLGRLIDISFPDSSGDISLTYDEAAGINGKGRLTSLTDPGGATSYFYNALGQLEREDRANTGISSLSTFYGYNPASADLDSTTYPSGLSVTYQRDSNGRISVISANGQPVVQNITYMPFGPVEDYVVGDNNLTVDRTYNDRYLLKDITVWTMDYEYQYYDDGSVSKITGPPAPETLANGTTQSVLVAATGKIDFSIGYGTRQNGYQNIMEDTSFSFTYNQDSRLKEVQVSGASRNVLAEYSYDAYGRRVKKTVDGVVTVFYYDINNNLISETDELGTPQRDYIYLGTQPVAMIVYGAQGGTYYFINDHLGTPQQLVDDSWTVVWQAAYLPYGEAQVLIETVVNNLRFPGQYYDEETGLHYNWNRYYDPSTGRYITADPIGLSGGLNLYLYVGGNPVNAVDPTGELALTTYVTIMGVSSTVMALVHIRGQYIVTKAAYETFKKFEESDPTMCNEITRWSHQVFLKEQQKLIGLGGEFFYKKSLFKVPTLVSR